MYGLCKEDHAVRQPADQHLLHVTEAKASEGFLAEDPETSSG